MSALAEFARAWEACGTPGEVGMVPPAPGAEGGVVVEDGNLAIVTAAVPALCRDVAQCLARWRALRDPTDADARRIAHATAAGLLCNGMNYTLWNERKRLLRRGLLPLEGEHAFIDLVASVHLKRPEIYEHRRFVAEYELCAAAGDEARRQGVLEREIRAAQRAAHLYPRNYAAWTHRAWAARRMGPHHVRLLAREREVDAVLAWLQLHVSDGSAGAYLATLLGLLPARRRASACLRSAQAAAALVARYPSHEALWETLRGVLAVARAATGAGAAADLVLDAARAYANPAGQRGRAAVQPPPCVPRAAAKLMGIGGGDVARAARHARRLLRWHELEREGWPRGAAGAGPRAYR